MIKDNNLSNSTLKVLSVYKKLLKVVCSKEELLTEFSDDSLLIYFSTLSEIGIKISKEAKPAKYFISENINLINLNRNDLIILNRIKKNINNVNGVLNYNNFLNKLRKFVNPVIEKKLQNIIDNPPFCINSHILIRQLQNYIKNQTPVIIIYNSPRVSNEKFKILPQYLKLENNKLYLWGKDINIHEPRCLKTERIVSVNPINENITSLLANTYAVCEINSSLNIHDLNIETYEILEENENKTIVRLNYFNQFEFIQKILSLGTECKIIEPKNLKEKIFHTINNIRSLYDEKLK